jgi:hypothetical protein
MQSPNKNAPVALAGLSALVPAFVLCKSLELWVRNGNVEAPRTIVDTALASVPAAPALDDVSTPKIIGTCNCYTVDIVSKYPFPTRPASIPALLVGLQ